MTSILRRVLRAAWLGPMAAAALSAVAAAPADTLAQRVVACTACHGREGRASSEGYFPRIAGKPSGYLFHQLRNFRDGRRRYALMTGLVDHLDDDYLREIADYFAALDLPYPAPAPVNAAPAVRARGEALALRGDGGQDGRGVPACVRCHGAAMTGVAPAIPGLLGLPRDYLVAQLGAWKTGGRRAAAPDCMAEIAAKLTPADVEAVSAWLASRPLPADPHPAASLPAALPLRCGDVPDAAR